MYIPLEKSNTKPCKLYATRRPTDGTEYTRKPFGGRGSAPHPAEGAYSARTNPLVGGERLAAPFPSTPSPLSGLASPTPTPKLVPTPLDGSN